MYVSTESVYGLEKIRIHREPGASPYDNIVFQFGFECANCTKNAMICMFQRCT